MLTETLLRIPFSDWSPLIDYRENAPNPVTGGFRYYFTRSQAISCMPFFQGQNRRFGVSEESY